MQSPSPDPLPSEYDVVSAKSLLSRIVGAFKGSFGVSAQKLSYESLSDDEVSCHLSSWSDDNPVSRLRRRSWACPTPATCWTCWWPPPSPWSPRWTPSWPDSRPGSSSHSRWGHLLMSHVLMFVFSVTDTSSVAEPAWRQCVSDAGTCLQPRVRSLFSSHVTWSSDLTRVIRVRRVRGAQSVIIVTRNITIMTTSTSTCRQRLCTERRRFIHATLEFFFILKYNK